MPATWSPGEIVQALKGQAKLNNVIIQV